MNTKQKIEVMQAFLGGRTVEYREKAEQKWTLLDKTLDEPAWDWWENEYRIKPEPLTVWVNVFKSGIAPWNHKTKEDAERAAEHEMVGYIRTVKLVEVVE